MPEVSGVVERIFGKNGGWCAGLLKMEDGCVKFNGDVDVEEGDEVTLVGTWSTHPRFGKQLKASGMKYAEAMDSQGLCNYLANNKAFKGIGPKKAHDIAYAFGDRFGEVLESNPEEIKHVGKLTDENLEILQAEWRSRSIYNSVSVWLSTFELTPHQIKLLIEKYGGDLQEKITEDPYIICREVNGIGFLKNDKIALNMGISPNAPSRINAAILFVLWESINSGHCWVEHDELFKVTEDLLELNEEKARITKQFKVLNDQREIVVINHGVGKIIAVKMIFDREQAVFNAIAHNAKDTNRRVDPDDVRRFIESSSLNDGQGAAMLKAMTNKISLISGAAGSGKSFTIGKIVEYCKNRGWSVALAAPTGRAAKRMKDLSGYAASTIHRLLGFNGVEWSDETIDADVVILDEVSMMDINLAWRFFRGINLLRTQIIFVGDHNQLPPVGPGNILRDMINRDLVPQTMLDQVVRQAGQLKENCNAILDGNVAPDATEEDGVFPWELVREDGDNEMMRAQLMFLIEGMLNAGEDVVKNVQVLTPTKLGDLGTRALNVFIQDAIHRIQHNGRYINEKCKFKTKDKVMQMRNNYDMDVMNGEIGVVVHSEPGDVAGTYDLTIDFDGFHHVINSGESEMDDIQLAYACTIHKYQGSEVPICIAIIHSSHMFMLHRNLMYTAVTRARKQCILLCNNRGLYGTVAKVVVDGRRTFMEILKKNDEI